MLLRVANILIVVAALEQSAVDLRVQGLYSAIEQLRELRVLRHIRDFHTVVFQVLGRASSGEDLDAERLEPFCEVQNTGFVRDGEKGACDGHG